jgi:hypothetical protein
LAEIHADDLGEGPPVASPVTSDQSTGHIDRSTNDASTCSPSSSTTSSVQTRSRRTRYDGKTSGVSKPVATCQKARPDVLLSQLEEALYGDDNMSTDFKWKASVLFNELKKLIENESTNQQLGTVTSGSQRQVPLLPHPESQKRKPKQNSRRSQPEERMFPCTSLDCSYSTNSAMDWRRHEETHWPQKRYMCIECPPTDVKAPKCSFCMLSLSPAVGVTTHYLQCDSARRNGRTFARKDKLSEHLQKEHSMPQSSAMSQALISTFSVDSGWPKRCKFCDVLFDSWDYRTQHLIEDHFKRGADHRLWQRSSSHSQTKQGGSNNWSLYSGSSQPEIFDSVSTQEAHNKVVYRRDYQGARSSLGTCNFDTEFTREPTQNTYRRDLLGEIAQQQFHSFSYNRPKISSGTLANSQLSEGFGKVSKLERGAINEPPSVTEEYQINKEEHLDFIADQALTGRDIRNPKPQGSALQPSTLEVSHTHNAQPSSSSDLPNMFNMTKLLSPISPGEVAKENKQLEVQEQITMRIAQNGYAGNMRRYHRRASAPKPLWKKMVLGAAHEIHEAVIDGKKMLWKERPKSVDASLSSAMASVSIQEESLDAAIRETDISWLERFVKKGSRVKPIPSRGSESKSAVQMERSKATVNAHDASSLLPPKLKPDHDV